MYPQKATLTIIPAKHNLRNVILETKNSTKRLLKSSFTLRRFSLGDTLRNMNDIKREVLKLMAKDDIINTLRKNLLTIPESLKSQSAVIIRTWAHQCECVVAQRFRRGQQMFCLYSKLWEEHALKEFLKTMKQQVVRKGKELMLGAVGVTAYNWENNRISESEVKAHVAELEYMQMLKNKTMICNTCNNSKSGKKTTTIGSDCDCPNTEKSYVPYDNWTVFIEKEDMIVWRRLHKSGSYEYKVYGSYDDVCADDFLNVQIDIEYRRQWDNTAVVLNLIEKDPIPESNSDVIYWEMLWPRLFANRDYVFTRRYMIDLETKTILLVSKHTEHPCCPSVSTKFRVQDYWSNMVIRPHTDYNSPGLVFGLTYFDNPGVNIPQSITTWVAYRAMPEFLNRLRDAAKDYEEYCEKEGCDRAFNLRGFVEKEMRKEKSKSDKCSKKSHRQTGGQPSTPGIEIMTSPSPIIQADVSKHTYWKYLQPTYYFS